MTKPCPLDEECQMLLLKAWIIWTALTSFFLSALMQFLRLQTVTGAQQRHMSEGKSTFPKLAVKAPKADLPILLFISIVVKILILD